MTCRQASHIGRSGKVKLSNYGGLPSILRHVLRYSGRSRDGFTLIELMVVIVVIGVLMSIGLPAFRSFMQQGNVSQAEAFLQQIAAQQRIFQLRTGSYLFSSTNDEQHLEDQLGVNLEEAADFCLVVVCRSTCVNESGTAGTTSANYVANAEAGDPAIEFEVWAILRATTGAVSGPSGVSCTPADVKFAPSGWVQSSGVAAAGTVAVLRYPPPLDGPDSVSGIDSIHFDWHSGVSLSHAVINR